MRECAEVWALCKQYCLQIHVYIYIYIYISSNGMGPSLHIYIYIWIYTFRINYIFRFDDRARRHAKNASREGPIPFDEQDIPVRLLVQHLQETAHLLYVPPRTVCIDEGLVRYNGKCKLKVYEPSKPGCYGIKMYLLCDTDKHYTYYIDMYRKGGPPLHYSGQKIVDRLITGARISEVSLSR